MKKRGTTIILLIVLIVGLSLLLYPTVSDWWNSMHQSYAIANYDSILSEMSEEDYSHLFEPAVEYNEELKKLAFPLMYYDEVEGYDQILDITGTGIMGYIDIPKIAVMPQNKADVLTLLAATEEMYRCYADRPLITMSMSATGVITRLCGEVFGSAMTFGAVGQVSAPGQIPVEKLNSALEIIHNAI